MQHDFILLDRSGSMSNLWVEALGAINSYVKKLADEKVDTGVTLAVFDGDEPFRIIRDRITPSTWKPVTNEDAMPRGMTPLNDATMQLVNLAEKGSPWGQPYERVAIVIMTDGDENHSTEFSVYKNGTQKVKEKLDQCRARGWQVQFLGANFDNQRQAASYGNARGQTISTSAVNFGATMDSMAMKRSAYGLTGQSISWSEDEQEALKSDKKVDTSTT